MKTLYVEPTSGISGDMTVAALLDAGGSREGLLSALDSLPVSGFEVEAAKTEKGGIVCTAFHVAVRGQDKHRRFSEILDIIAGCAMRESAKALAARIFTVLVEAEACVHGIPADEVHFHEVGALDSIVDIVSAAYLLDQLDIEKTVSVPLREGRGHVRCAHGELPVPAPAVLEIARQYHIPLNITDTEGEMVTPTGIAILAALDPVFTPAGLCRTKAAGYGAGQKEFPCANVLRITVLESNHPGSCDESDEIFEIVTAIDDTTPEQLGFLMEILQNQGARDVYYTPVTMKKNRPAQELTILCDAENKEALIEAVFRHSGAIGVRIRPCERRIMRRGQYQVDTKYGEIEMKRCEYHGIRKEKAEYESARAAALKHKVPLHEILREICYP